MSDWDNDAPTSLHYYAGNDLNMPGDFREKVREELHCGKINVAGAQASAVRILNLILKTNLLN